MMKIMIYDLWFMVYGFILIPEMSPKASKLMVDYLPDIRHINLHK